MADTYITVGSTGHKKKIKDLGDSTYSDVSYPVKGGYAATEIVPAKATGSTGGLGKITTMVQNVPDYVRVDTRAVPYGYVDWRIQCSKQHDVQLYKARSIVDNVTLTLSDFTEADTLVINGLTYTGESTANTADYASRKASTAGASDTLDATALAAVINADYAVATAGTSVAATDKLIFTTDEGEFEIVAAAAADYPGGKYKLDATAATEAASIVLAINHRDTITVGQDTTAIAADQTPENAGEDYALADEMAGDHNTHTALTTVHKQATAAVSFVAATTEGTLAAEANALRTAMLAHYADTDAHNSADTTNRALVLATTVATNAATARTLLVALITPWEAHIATAKVQAGDTFTVNGLVFTGHASATTAANREFKVDEATASDTADELVALLDDGTYGAENTTSVNTSGAIAVTRDTSDSLTISAAPAAASVHSCITLALPGGVPGVLAAATPVSAEISVTPTWTAVLTLTEEGDQLTVTDIDCPGILASATDAVVTLTPGTPGAPDGQDLATVIQAAASAHITVSHAPTLLGLSADGAVNSNVAINSTTAGTIYTQEVNGYEYCYAGVNDDTGSGVLVVGATLRQ